MARFREYSYDQAVMLPVALGPQLWGSYLYADADVVYAYIAIIVGFGFLLEYGLVRPATAFVKRRLRIDTGDR